MPPYAPGSWRSATRSVTASSRRSSSTPVPRRSRLAEPARRRFGRRGRPDDRRDPAAAEAFPMSRIACPPRLHVMDRPALLRSERSRALGRRSIRGRRRRRAPGGPAPRRGPRSDEPASSRPGDGGADRRVAGSAIVVDERLREVDLGGRGAHLRPVQARWPELAERLLPATPRSTGPAGRRPRPSAPGSRRSPGTCGQRISTRSS